MISKKSLQRYKNDITISLIYILLCCCLLPHDLYSFIQKKQLNIVSDAITCISIIFAFSQSCILTIYTNTKINRYMKNNKQFDKFINDNKSFLKSTLYWLIILFIINILNINYCFSVFYISSQHIILWITLLELAYALSYVEKYMNVYKNSYSNLVDKDNKLESKNDD